MEFDPHSVSHTYILVQIVAMFSFLRALHSVEVSSDEPA